MNESKTGTLLYFVLSFLCFIIVLCLHSSRNIEVQPGWQELSPMQANANLLMPAWPLHGPNPKAWFPNHCGQTAIMLYPIKSLLRQTPRNPTTARNQLSLSSTKQRLWYQVKCRGGIKFRMWILNFLPIIRFSLLFTIFLVRIIISKSKENKTISENYSFRFGIQPAVSVPGQF